MGNDLTKGTTYVDGMMLNAANLNAHVDDSTIKSTAISARTAKTSVAITDEFLINDSGTLKKATGAALYEMTTQPGTIIQSTYGSYAVSSAFTSTIPLDDTIPQNTEGTQFISISFTPRFANSKMVVRFSGYVSMSVVGHGVVAVFRDSGVNAMVAVATYMPAADIMLPVHILTTDLPATASTITYTVRAGPNVAGNLRFNGISTARRFGGVMAATLEVQEVRMP